MTPAHTIWPPGRKPLAVIQPLPGIGDMVWHIPHIRAIAAHHGHPVTVLTKPRSLADQLLAHEPCVRDVQWIDLNPAGRRGIHDGVRGFRRLVRDLRDQMFRSVVLLHHSDLLAAATWLAGIPDRRGYGFGQQKWFLNTGPFLPSAVKAQHQHTRATRYLAAAGLSLPSAEPALTVPAAIRTAAVRKLDIDGHCFIAVGIGSSEPLRQWGTARFAELVTSLLDAGWKTLVLVGGPEDAAAAHAILNAIHPRASHLRLALGWNLTDVIGLLAEATFYVGNNTGVMNIAAATGIRTYALFGTTQPFTHASQIVAVTAPTNDVHDGMKRVTLRSVLDTIVADRGRLSP